MKIILIPFSLLHIVYVYIRNLMFDMKILESKEFNVPIICVGNLSVGGTGKTPHVEYIINVLKRNNIVVLSRGYRRISKGFKWVSVSSLAKDVGDESLQIKIKYPDVNVAVCEDRNQGINIIREKYPNTDVILMDDGMQHRYVNPGLKILLTKHEKPFYKDYMMPYGSLREDRKSAKRADIIIMTKCPDNITNNEKEIIQKEINKYKETDTYFSYVRYKRWKKLSGNYELNERDTYNILLITGISNANDLLINLRSEGHSVTHKKYPDHHNYEKKDIQNILSLFKKHKSTKNIILTTEKDKEKLLVFKEEIKEYPIYFIPIEIKIDNEKKIKNILTNYVKKNK